MSRPLIAVLVAVPLLAVPIVAPAATPKKNSYFIYCPRKFSCPVSFQTTKSGKRIKSFRYFNACANVPVLLPTIRITKGAFSYRGTRKDSLRRSIKVRIAARFVTSRKAKGTVRFTRSGCSAKTLKFTARRHRKPVAPRLPKN
jgi:hypothetical protein